MLVRWHLKRPIYDFKNSFCPVFVCIHLAKIIFSRESFCLCYFWAKIHKVKRSNFPLNNFSTLPNPDSFTIMKRNQTLKYPNWIKLSFLSISTAALNLAKFRKAQQQLEEAEERSKMAELNMARMRGDRFFIAGNSHDIWNQKLRLIR